MEVTRLLIDEHMMISQGLECMKTARDKLEKEIHPPRIFFDKAFIFFMFYADHFHHYKEEFLMFGCLAQKKKGLLDLEIGSLRQQHDEAKELLNSIQRSLNGYESENEIAATILLKHTAAFISVLSRHLYREERVFFPMVEAELSPAEKNDLMDQFRSEASKHDQWNTMEENQNLLEEMRAMVIG